MNKNAGRVALILVCTMTIGGCTSGMFAGLIANQSGDVREKSEPATANALVEFAASLPQGQARSFNDPATGMTIGVRVLRSYTAASGHECLDFLALDPHSTAQEHLICADGASWAEVAPLIAAVTPNFDSAAQ